MILSILVVLVVITQNQAISSEINGKGIKNAENDNNAGKQTLVFSIAENWEPYYSEALPNGGAVVDIVKRAFEREGYQIKIDWLPWPRAFGLAKRGEYDGIIGAWHTKQREYHFNFSAPIMATDIVVFKRKGELINYKKIQDLESYKIGVALDSAPHELLKVKFKKNLQVAVSSYFNIQKLAAKRFDLLVDDRLNALYVINAYFPELRNSFEILSPPLQINYLYVLMSKERDDHQVVVSAFNRGLSAIKQDGTYEAIIRKYKLPVYEGSD